MSRRLVVLSLVLVVVCLAGPRLSAPISHADTAAPPTATSGPVPEDPCPHITGMTLSALSGGSLHAAASVHLHQLLHAAVEWRLNDPAASTLQPTRLVIRHAGHAIYRGWLNLLYPHGVADVVLEGVHNRGRAMVTAQLGTPPCSSSMAQAVRVLPGAPPRKPWVFPDCVGTYTVAGAACWLIAGGFKAHQPISVSYRLQPANGGKAISGGLRGQANGHGIFGSIALDLGPEVSWQTAVLRVDVKAGRSVPVRTVVHLSR